MAKKYKIDPDSEVSGTGTGYVYVTTTPDYTGKGVKRMKDHDKAYVQKSRVIIEQKIKRPMNPDKEEVHHKNENKGDDRPSNLELKTRGEHSKGHATKNKFWKKSPLNKPKKTSVQRVVSQFLAGF